jgi:fluoride exporter
MPLLPALAVCLGASLGALARWQLALWLNSPGSWLPAGTLAANLAGGALVGLALAVVEAHPQIDPVWRLALITGFLGALTTFSTFSAETVLLLQQGRVLPALALSFLHLAGSLLLTWAGLVVGRAVL